MHQKSLLIIGGSGFFGTSILYFLLKNSSYNKKFNKIILLSRNIKNTQMSKDLKKKFKISLLKKDISKVKKLPYADYVLYCVTMDDHKQDYCAVTNYCNLAQKFHKSSKILFTSSGAVYGQQPKNLLSFKENYLRKNKKIFFKSGYKKNYSKYKLLCEKKFQLLGKLNHKVSIARCFSFVGNFIPRNIHYVIGNIIESILKKQTINIQASYPIFRSIMHADDLARWLLKILFNSNNHCPVYNVGSDNVVSIQKLSKLLSIKYKVPLKLRNFTKKINLDRYIPNIGAAKKNLDLNIKFNSFEGICKTVRSIKKNAKKTN
jgi:nucleoside-diphosphate-sugar epimerase